MQKTLLLVVSAIAAIFTSCTQPKVKVTENGKTVHDAAGTLDSNDVVLLDSADAWIRNYHQSLKSNGEPEIGLSFMLDANVLREYLNAHADIAKLDVYMAKPNDSVITVVYVPAVQVIEGDSVTYVEQPVTLPGSSVEYALDHAMPCPVCADRVKIPGSSAHQ